jgi:hypothetical protein
MLIWTSAAFGHWLHDNTLKLMSALAPRKKIIPFSNQIKDSLFVLKMPIAPRPLRQKGL